TTVLSHGSRSYPFPPASSVVHTSSRSLPIEATHLGFRMLNRYILPPTPALPVNDTTNTIRIASVDNAAQPREDMGLTLLSRFDHNPLSSQLVSHGPSCS